MNLKNYEIHLVKSEDKQGYYYCCNGVLIVTLKFWPNSTEAIWDYKALSKLFNYRNINDLESYFPYHKEIKPAAVEWNKNQGLNQLQIKTMIVQFLGVYCTNLQAKQRLTLSNIILWKKSFALFHARFKLMECYSDYKFIENYTDSELIFFLLKNWEWFKNMFEYSSEERAIVTEQIMNNDLNFLYRFLLFQRQSKL